MKKTRSKKKEYVSLSPSEREVIAVLWEADRPLPAAKVAEELARKTGWHLSTTRTFLKRLETKGAVEIRKLASERGAVYIPLLDEEDVCVAEAETTLKKYFNGTLCDLTRAFVERNRVSVDELRQLRDIIERELDDDAEEPAKPAKTAKPAKKAKTGCKKRCK